MKQVVLTGMLGVGLLLLTWCGDESVAATNGPSNRPLQTGQTGCYDASGNTEERSAASPKGMYSINRSVSFRTNDKRAKSTSSSSFVPRMVTQLIFRPRPASSATCKRSRSECFRFS